MLRGFVFGVSVVLAAWLVIALFVSLAATAVGETGSEQSVTDLWVDTMYLCVFCVAWWCLTAAV